LTDLEELQQVWQCSTTLRCSAFV